MSHMHNDTLNTPVDSLWFWPGLNLQQEIALMLHPSVLLLRFLCDPLLFYPIYFSMSSIALSWASPGINLSLIQAAII